MSAELALPALPNYQFPESSPAYTRTPAANEHRLHHPRQSTDVVSVVPDGSFVKHSKTGSLTLQLFGQQTDASLPVFNTGATIHGKVSITKRETVASVDIKLDGHLRLQEIGGAGTSSDRILAQQLVLWTKEDSSVCPSSLDFAIPLRLTYEKEGSTYPLPPTYEIHLSGLPGFRADVFYSITATVTKTKGSLFGNHTVVSTPFVYLPRTRPAAPLPYPPPQSDLLSTAGANSPDWEAVETVMGSRSPHTNPIVTKLYIPAGRTFCMKGSIPFKFHIASSALSLATFLPCSPTAYPASTSKTHDNKRGVTRVYVVRQASVDVRQLHAEGTKTDIFKVIQIGEGTFRRLGDGADWAAWEGEVPLDESIAKVGSFKSGGLWVKDCLILSIIPPNPLSSPLIELRAVVPIRLVTDPHSSDVDLDHTDWSDTDVKYAEPE